MEMKASKLKQERTIKADIPCMGLLAFVIVLTIGLVMEILTPETTDIAMRRLIMGSVACILILATWTFIERSRALAALKRMRDVFKKSNKKKPDVLGYAAEMITNDELKQQHPEQVQATKAGIHDRLEPAPQSSNVVVENQVSQVSSAEKPTETAVDDKQQTPKEV